MGPALATSLVVANVVGAGIFTVSGFLAGMLGDPRLLIGIWVFGGILAIAGAFCYAEIGAQFPRAGGEYAFLGEAYGPLLAFLSGWASLFAGFSAPIAAAAIAFSDYFSFYYPALRMAGDQPANASALPGQIMAAGVIILFSLLHYRRVQVGGSIHLALTSVKVAIIAVFILAGFVLGKGNVAHFTSGSLPSGGNLSAVAMGLILVMFSYSGWNAAAYIGGEIRNPQKNLPRALLLGTLTVVVMYVAINALYVYAAPVSEMSRVIRIAELATLNLFGINVAPYLNLIFMGTILSSISAMIIAGPRVYYAMARDGLFPRWLAKVDSRFETPRNAILLQGLFSIILVFVARFEQLLIGSGVVLIVFAALTVGAVFVIRKRHPGPRPYSAWGYPVTPLLFIAVSILMVASSFRDRWAESRWGLVVVLTGIPFFYYWNRKRNRSN
jgi:APA family basic amino acid/polyamine antiporter